MFTYMQAEVKYVKYLSLQNEPVKSLSLPYRVALKILTINC
jgi:hypothetical protein